MGAWTAWRDETLEGTICNAVSLDAPWRLVERFAGLVRESGTEAEAAAVREISARERIHGGICTTIWGSPDFDGIERQPSIPVVEVGKSDGARLLSEAKDLEAKAGGLEIGVVTRLETRWRQIPVLVAEVRGAQ